MSVTAVGQSPAIDPQQKIQNRQSQSQAQAKAEMEKQRAAQEAAKRAEDEKQCLAQEAQRTQARTTAQDRKGGNIDVLA